MMKKEFNPRLEWKSEIPVPVCTEHPEFNELYRIAWDLAHDHMLDIPGMPQTPYMDEAFCDTDIWIWDSCFMALFCKYAQSRFPGVETLKNFYKVLYDGGQLPEIVSRNAPAWTGVLPGQKTRMVIHIMDNPPLFAWAEYQNALFSGDREHVADLLLKKRYLQKHFEALEALKTRTRIPGVRSETCWIKHEKGYFWEGGRSGMDNTPRGRIGEHAEENRPNNPDMLWIDAISQQGLAAFCIAALAELIGEKTLADEWNARYEAIRETVNRNYWDENDGCYYDIGSTHGEFMKILTPASFWPLVSGMGTPAQAEALSRLLTDPRKLGGVVPLVSLARDDADFNRDDGRYWRGSVWVPTAYAAIKGIERYGMYSLARELSGKILTHMYETFRQYEPHTIWECYHPERPEPARSCDENTRIVRSNFCGWSALAPIGLYLENVIGIYSVNAFTDTVKWALPERFAGELGVRNFRFGETVADLIAFEGSVFVTSNRPFTLIVNGRRFSIPAGSSRQTLSVE